MSLDAIWALIVGAKDEVSIGVVIIIVLMSLVQISKINLNPWDKVLGWIGKKMTAHIDKKVDDLQEKLDKHIAEDEQEKLESQRRDILDFANACMNKRKHTQEQFNFVIKQCDEYEKFIEENDVKNGEITDAIEEIHRLYKKCRQENSFLKPGEEFD